MTSLSGVTPFGSYRAFSCSGVLKVPSSLTACPHGMFFAPGMCPPRCACSVGYSGGAKISPLNSFGDPQTPEECLEPLLRDDVPGHGIVDVLAPVDERGTGDVAQVVVRRGIVVHLDDLDILIPKGAFHEARVDQDFRMRVCRHAMFLGRSEVIRCYITCV